MHRLLARFLGSVQRWYEGFRPEGRPGRLGLLGLWSLAAAIPIFGIITVHRQAFSHSLKGDLGVFFRAGWAARTGADLYRVTDGHGWHYHYLPLLASLMMPLADPPPGAAGAYLPYWALAAIWYCVNVVCLFAALHILASALESLAAKAGRQHYPRYSTAWWALRLWPFLLILFPAGDALGAGQVTTPVLLLLASAGAAMLTERRGLAGAFLGFAGILKLFPLYLLIYPLLRRNRPMLVGAAAGMLLGLLLPVVLMGPVASFEAYRGFVAGRLLGEVNGQGDPLIMNEMHGSHARIQSFEYMIYDSLNPDATNRPNFPSTGYFVAHIAVSGALTLAVLWTMRRRGDPLAEFLLLASLAVLVVPILPVARPHYYALAALAFAGLYAAVWPRRKGLWPGWPVTLVAIAFVAAGLLDALNQHEAVDFGLATYVALALVAVTLSVARGRSAAAAGQASPNQLSKS